MAKSDNMRTYNLGSLRGEPATITLLNKVVIRGKIGWASMNMVSITGQIDDGFGGDSRDVLIPVSSIAHIVPHKEVI